ncbi:MULTISPECIES: hypothetical protein [Lactobacillus]|uniref:Uncharacterized protein n=1 Tax=Lactobacillus xujianguonis TaxID=2495899 RepID=A0A437SSE4_9LACO|nr:MULTISPECIES: hypothetical protein [Lactobacillus]RVU69861.1 hypothetical protein EJK17_10820 [Lactobacillus xujianguonis]RVU71929.1 hypothetical protein EJK20_11210 [Lactobacillus xujianguonis]
MKQKRILALLMGMLFAVSLIFVVNASHSDQVEATTFQKVAVPKKFRGTWYGYDYSGKLKAFKITRTQINLAGFGTANSKTRTYKYAKKAHMSQVGMATRQLIKAKGNRMLISVPYGESSSAYVTNNRKKLYVGIDTWVDTYYKSKSSARKNHKADQKKRQSLKLHKLVWGF